MLYKFRNYNRDHYYHEYEDYKTYSCESGVIFYDITKNVYQLSPYIWYFGGQRTVLVL